MGRRLRFPEAFQHARRSAYLDGFSLHAGVRVHENDREGLERLCRYAARPPIALHRLSEGEGGKLVSGPEYDCVDPGPSYDGE